VRGTFQQWLRGERDRSQLAITYSGMFFELCRVLGRPGIASYPAEDEIDLEQDGIRVVSRPVRRGTGWNYHLAMLRNARSLLRDVKRSGATDLIVMDGITYWSLLTPAYFRGVRVWPSLHTVLWAKQKRPGRLKSLQLYLDGVFLRKCASGVVAVSDDIMEQLRVVCRGPLPKAAVFLPAWRREDFDPIAPANWSDPVFKVLFVGRVEENKGVLDFVRAAADVVNSSSRMVQFLICGTGAAESAVAAAIAKLNLEESVRIVGHCDRQSLLEKLGASHVVVVPTRGDFPEGLNKAAMEAILAGRPVVLSSCVPARRLLAPAAIEFHEGDSAACATAVLQLASSEKLFQEKVAAAVSLRDGFYNNNRSWLAVVHRLLEREANDAVPQTTAARCRTP
jgi:glycogen(starch) synthase